MTPANDQYQRGSKTFSHLSLDRLDGITVITLMRPKVLNALHPDACRELGEALDSYETDGDARVAIITGSGDRAFCAGFDLRYAEKHPEVYNDPLIGSEVVRRPDRRKPLIAAVNGIAWGLGFELALACDLIVASSNATFALPEPTIGLAAMGGGVVRLTRELGPKRALGLILSGDAVQAAEGYRLGFVNEVADQEVMPAALRWAEKLKRCAPLSLVASKEMAYRSLEISDLGTALDPRQYPAVMRVLASEDAHEGRRAFLESRKPSWKNC